MTDEFAPGDDPESRPDTRPRRLRRWTIAVVLLAVALGAPISWRVAANSTHLEQGSVSYLGHAWRMRVGNDIAYCYGITPGETVKFGFSFDNTGSHAIKIKKMQALEAILSETVTMSRVDLRSSDPDGPERPFAPLILAPGQEVLFFVTITVPAGDQWSEGSSIDFNAVDVSYRVLHIDYDKEVPLGYWIKLHRPEPGKLPCQSEPTFDT